tara:strand:- start:95 stop:379 length:285 start_codon:yes stop_codon:yes gene_type:complete
MEYRADSIGGHSIILETGSEDMSHVVLGQDENGRFFTRSLHIPEDETTSDFEGNGEYGMSLKTALLDLVDRLERYGSASKVGTNLSRAIAQALS